MQNVFYHTCRIGTYTYKNIDICRELRAINMCTIPILVNRLMSVGLNYFLNIFVARCCQGFLFMILVLINNKVSFHESIVPSGHPILWQTLHTAADFMQFLQHLHCVFLSRYQCSWACGTCRRPWKEPWLWRTQRATVKVISWRRMWSQPWKISKPKPWPCLSSIRLTPTLAKHPPRLRMARRLLITLQRRLLPLLLQARGGNYWNKSWGGRDARGGGGAEFSWSCGLAGGR